MTKYLKPCTFFFFLINFSINVAFAQQRHALLIGINNYLKPDTLKLHDKIGRPACKDLTASINNVNAITDILNVRFGFKHEEIQLLTNEKATNKGILHALEDMKNTCNKGDIVFFYFSGYGSLIRNSASNESDGMDKTIVPYDGVYKGNDLREKELNEIFIDIINKGVTLTAIFECGYKSSPYRGINIEEETAVPSSEIIKEKKDDNDIKNYGALIVNAANDNQSAFVKKYNDIRLGVFTKSMIDMLKVSGNNTPSVDLCNMVVSNLRNSGECQTPIIICNEWRGALNLAGTQQLNDDIKVTAIKINPDNTVDLQGGIALGIDPGTELENENNTVRLEVTGNTGISLSSAKIRAGSYMDLKKDAVYKVTQKAIGGKPKIRICLPVIDLQKDKLLALADSVLKIMTSKFLILFYDAPASVDYLLYYNNTRWILNFNGLDHDLGEKLNLNLLNSLLESNKTMGVRWPLYKDLYNKIANSIATEYTSIGLTDIANSDYFLSGIAFNKRINYMLTKTISDTSLKLPFPTTGDFSSVDDDNASAIGLCESAYKLGRLKAWLTLESTGKQNDFPWDFYIKNDSAAKLIKEGTVRENDEYRFFLFRNAHRYIPDTAVKKRWVYLFEISGDFNGIRLLLPGSKDNSAENNLPLNENDTLMEDLLNSTLIPMFPTYNLVVLATDNALVNPARIEQGIQGMEQQAANTMEALVDEMGSKTMGPNLKPPTNWSIQKITLNVIQK